jgi:hypothetical protein
MDCWAAGVTLFCFLYQRLPIRLYEEDSAVDIGADIVSTEAKIFREILKIKSNNTIWSDKGRVDYDDFSSSPDRAAVLDAAKHLLVVDVRARWTAMRALDRLWCSSGEPIAE